MVRINKTSYKDGLVCCICWTIGPPFSSPVKSDISLAYFFRVSFAKDLLTWNGSVILFGRDIDQRISSLSTALRRIGEHFYGDYLTLKRWKSQQKMDVDYKILESTVGSTGTQYRMQFTSSNLGNRSPGAQHGCGMIRVRGKSERYVLFIPLITEKSR